MKHPPLNFESLDEVTVKITMKTRNTKSLSFLGILFFSVIILLFLIYHLFFKADLEIEMKESANKTTTVIQKAKTDDSATIKLITQGQLKQIFTNLKDLTLTKTHHGLLMNSFFHWQLIEKNKKQLTCSSSQTILQNSLAIYYILKPYSLPIQALEIEATFKQFITLCNITPLVNNPKELNMIYTLSNLLSENIEISKILKTNLEYGKKEFYKGYYQLDKNPVRAKAYFNSALKFIPETDKYYRLVLKLLNKK